MEKDKKNKSIDTKSSIKDLEKLKFEDNKASLKEINLFQRDNTSQMIISKNAPKFLMGIPYSDFKKVKKRYLKELEDLEHDEEEDLSVEEKKYSLKIDIKSEEDVLVEDQDEVEVDGEEIDYEKIDFDDIKKYIDQQYKNIEMIKLGLYENRSRYDNISLEKN